MGCLLRNLIRSILFSSCCLSVLSAAAAQSLPASSCQGDVDTAALQQRVLNLVHAELFPAAECAARTLVERSPDSAGAHALLAYILYRENKPELSLAEYTAAARIETPSGDDLAVVALDYVLLKDYTDAEKWMSAAVQRRGQNAQYWYYLGRIEYNLNSFNKAVAAFQQARKLRPEDLRPLYNLGLCFEGLGDTVQAEALYREAISQEQRSTTRDAQPYLDLGSLLLRNNKAADALPVLREASQRDGQNAAIHEQLGKGEERLGQLAESRHELEEAVTLAPSVSALHFELGRVYQQLHQTEEAKQQFALCASLAGTHSDKDDLNLNFTQLQAQ